MVINEEYEYAMSGIEEFIKLQNRMNEQLCVPKVISSLTEDKSLIALAKITRQVEEMRFEPALASLQRELQKYHEISYSVCKTMNVVQQVLDPILEEYNRVSDIVSVAKGIYESIEPVNDFLKGVQPVLADNKLFSQLSDIRKCVLQDPTGLFALKEALERNIDASLWEYTDEIYGIDESFSEEMREDILKLVEENDKTGYLQCFFEKWGEKGKSLIIQVVKFVLITFFSGLMTYWCEPIYKVLTPSFLLNEEDSNTVNKIQIPVNTEIHVWNEVTNNYIEITYIVQETEFHGYIERREFESNTEKISDEIGLEHIYFINNVTQLLSEEWGIDPEQVYVFLKKDTDLLEEYLLKCYEALSLLEESELIDSIEKYCGKHNITLPVSFEAPD